MFSTPRAEPSWPIRLELHFSPLSVGGSFWFDERGKKRLLVRKGVTGDIVLALDPLERHNGGSGDHGGKVFHGLHR